MRAASLGALLSGLLLLTAGPVFAQRIETAPPESRQSLDAAIVAALRPTHEGMRCAELRSGIRDILWHHQLIMQDPTCRRAMFQSPSN